MGWKRTDCSRHSGYVTADQSVFLALDPGLAAAVAFYHYRALALSQAAAGKLDACGSIGGSQHFVLQHIAVSGGAKHGGHQSDAGWYRAAGDGVFLVCIAA